MAYLGIDVGTSAVKLCVMDAAGAVIATTDAALSVQHPFAGASEQDPQAWYEAVCAAASHLHPELRSKIAAIGLSGQMHGAVLLDDQDQVIRPAILWNDGRASGESETLNESEPNIGQLAGVPAMPGFTAPKLLWLKTHAPQDHARIQSILLPKDEIGRRLHGHKVTDPSDAAGSHWLDQAHGQWSNRLCEISATDPSWLPELRPGTAIAGHLTAQAADDLGLPPGLPIATGAGDAVAGAVGIGAIHPGDGFLSLGTSGQLFVTTATYRPNPESRVHAYAHTLPGLWFQMACLLNGARPIAWLAERLGRPIAELLHEAETAQPGPLFMPYLTGERTPHGDTDIRAAFYGLSETTTQGDLMRAVVEGIAFAFADAAQALAAAGTRPERLLAIGGGTRSDMLLQMIADVLETPIGRSAGADVGPALGAARLAHIATGGAVATVAQTPEVSRWFTPRSDVAKALAPRLAAYRAMYPALCKVQALLGPQ